MTATRPALTRVAWVTIIAIAVAIAWTHSDVLSAGFRSDDYFAIRPWTMAELRAVLTGSWDPLGVQDPYHRPLTALYQSLWHPLFGYDARAMHAVSLIELGVVAVMLAAFVGRELQRPAAGLLAALMLIVHPMLPDSTTAWIFNQMSLLADLTVVGALLVWQRTRTGPARGWWPVWALAALSFYIKEDGVMLVPALLCIQWWRARRVGDVPAPTPRLVLSGLAVLAVLAAVRVAVFPVAAPWPPSLDSAGYYLRNLLSGPFHVLVRLPGDSPSAAAGSAAVVLAMLAALVIVWRTRPRTPAVALLGAGALLMAWFGVPLLLIAGPTRAHLLTLAAALMITASMAIVYDAVEPPSARRWLIAGIGATLLALSLASRDINRRYAPCSDDSLHSDSLTFDIPSVAPELRAWLRAKPPACAANTYQPLPVDFRVSRPQQ